jgi:hypothetical protein
VKTGGDSSPVRSKSAKRGFNAHSNRLTGSLSAARASVMLLRLTGLRPLLGLLSLLILRRTLPVPTAPWHGRPTRTPAFAEART